MAADFVLEACVDSLDSALAAKEGGATRLELCANLLIGGTTPMPSLPGRGAQGCFHPPAQAPQLVKARGHGEKSPRRQNPP